MMFQAQPIDLHTEAAVVTEVALQAVAVRGVVAVAVEVATAGAVETEAVPREVPVMAASDGAARASIATAGPVVLRPRALRNHARKKSRPVRGFDPEAKLR